MHIISIKAVFDFMAAVTAVMSIERMMIMAAALADRVELARDKNTLDETKEQCDPEYHDDDR